jgi:hypothetical protein
VYKSIYSQSIDSTRICILTLFLNLFGQYLAFAQGYVTTFGLVSEFKTLHNARTLVSGDFNGDGITDLATSAGKKIQILLRESDSLEWHSFTVEAEYPVYEMASGNLSADNLSDIALLSDNQQDLQVYLAKSNGKFYLSWKKRLPSPFDQLLIADINSDGKMDILLYGKKQPGITVFAGRGGGTFTQGALLFPEISFSTVIVTDMNEDGINDVLASNWITNELLLYSGVGKMKFSEPSVTTFQNEPAIVAVAFLDGDPNKDIVVGFTNELYYQTLMGDGLGSFHLFQTVTLGSFASQLIIEDVNGDGKQDVSALCANDKSLRIGLNDGKGFLEEHIAFDAGTSPAGFVLIPYLSSRFIDAVILDPNRSRIRILHSTQEPISNADELMYAVGLNPAGIVTYDVNHDGWDDIMVANPGSQNISLLFNRHDGTFTGQISFESPTNSQFLQYSPLNNTLGLVLGSHPEVEKLSVMKINLHDYSASSFSLPSIGSPDILAVMTDSTDEHLHIYVLEREGDDVHALLTEYVQIDSARFIQRDITLHPLGEILTGTMGSFDNAGNLDLAYITVNGKTKQEEIYQSRGNRSHTFEPAKLSLAYDAQTGSIPILWAHDLNGDGIADLLVKSSEEGQTLFVSLGRADTTFSPPVFRIKNDVRISDRHDLQFADLNGDGIVDLVLRNSVSKTIQAYLGKGNGTFSPKMRLMSSKSTGGFVLSDVNNDGIPELIVTDSEKGIVKIISLEEHP